MKERQPAVIIKRKKKVVKIKKRNVIWRGLFPNFAAFLFVCFLFAESTQTQNNLTTFKLQNCGTFLLVGSFQCRLKKIHSMHG